jgi:glycine/D-amino acid oxidase-like deaminating enzyme
VHLFEAKPRLMSGATSACYYRLHRGYHYPRSPETGRESLDAETSFRAEYGEAVIDGGIQIYAIPRFGAKVSGDEFGRFLNQMGLPSDLVWCPSINARPVLSVAEPRIDAMMLARLVINAVQEAGVAVHLGSQNLDWLRDSFDKIIVAAYANTNAVLEQLGCQPEPYRFQVVEKPLVHLPDQFQNTSIVVMDHCCIDPHQWSDLHALGHVSTTIHSQNTGTGALVPDHLMPLIERGVVRHYEGNLSEVSRVRETVAMIAQHVPAVKGCEYVGSMFTVRAVLTGQEATDARPTLVGQVDDKVIRIFSGKLGTAVAAAKQATDILCNSKARVAA